MTPSEMAANMADLGVTVTRLDVSQTFSAVISTLNAGQQYATGGYTTTLELTLCIPKAVFTGVPVVGKTKMQVSGKTLRVMKIDEGIKGETWLLAMAQMN